MKKIYITESQYKQLLESKSKKLSKFLEKFKETFYNPDKYSPFDFYGAKKKIKNWPEVKYYEGGYHLDDPSVKNKDKDLISTEALDLENHEMLQLTSDKFVFWAGGDWQPMFTVTVNLVNGDLKVTDCHPHRKGDGKELKRNDALKTLGVYDEYMELKKQKDEEKFQEDCERFAKEYIEKNYTIPPTEESVKEFFTNENEYKNQTKKLIKTTLEKLQQPINENKILLEYSDIHDWYEFENNNMYELLQSIQKQQKIKFELINPSQYQAALNEFVKYGEFNRFPIKYIYNWKNLVLDNIAMLYNLNQINGHDRNFPFDEFNDIFNYSESETTNQLDLFTGEQEEITKYGSFDAWKKEKYEETGDKDYLKTDFTTCYDYLDEVYHIDDYIPFFSNGQPVISDFGMEPLLKLGEQLLEQESPEEIIVTLNKILDISHQRSDLSELFMKGGQKSLDMISNGQFVRESKSKNLIITEEQYNHLKEINDQIYSGEYVNGHIIDITPEENDLPDYFMEKLIKPRKFKLQQVNLHNLLQSDPSFKEYYDAGENRYEDNDEYQPDENEINIPIVIVDGEVLDGYNRASELIRRGNDTIEAFVALDVNESINEDRIINMTFNNVDFDYNEDKQTLETISDYDYKSNSIPSYFKNILNKIIYNLEKRGFNPVYDIVPIQHEDYIKFTTTGQEIGNAKYAKPDTCKVIIDLDSKYRNYMNK